MTKKLLLVMALGVMLVFAGCGNGEDAAGDAEGWADGTYEGTAEGYAGPITVEVTIEDGEMTNIEIVEEDETEDIAQPVYDELPGEIIENQGTEGVDAITDATETSEAIFEAVEEALEAAE
ncbi:FMN-binding protein [Natranaerobius thermophilus]|uniref:FMN-binding domain protein n=1 Tax=Natranaerobius thermophilus (strain ATCC BAA-1301 / DSM 18059 / JW/NM-WN-LF) TaxID=457570 RepID=B2A6Y5_NATTJ|nr:FMN-binding protein [Natranaerobius thermophilus]ACB85576.1 FMN-binding domain protein [Natranaerobius thermophilus JW/NM-WN-LF]